MMGQTVASNSESKKLMVASCQEDKRELVATLRGSRPAVQSASLSMTSLMTSQLGNYKRQRKTETTSPMVKTASLYDNFCKTGNYVIYDVIIWVQEGNCKKWLERILVLVRSTI